MTRARQLAEPHRLAVQRLAIELRQPQQVGDQPVHVRGAGVHVLQQAPAFLVERADVFGEQRLGEHRHGAQRRAQVVRDRIRKCLELAIGDLQFLGALAHVLFEPLLLDAQLAHGQGALQHRQGGGELDGLLDVVERAGLHGGDRGLERAVPGHDDRDQRRVDELRGFHEVDAVGARHLQVGQQQVEAALAHRGQRFGGATVKP